MIKNNGKVDRALELLRSDNVFVLSETVKYVYFKVKGKKLYDVIYDKKKDLYSCDCRNVRLDISCYHIVACKILRYANEVSAFKEED